MRRIGILVVCLLVVLGFYGKRRLLGWTLGSTIQGGRGRVRFYIDPRVLASFRAGYFSFSAIGSVWWPGK